MEAKDLRIGNWVRQPKDTLSTKYYPLDEFEWSLEDFSDLENGGYSIDMVEGIPLTEEWLLKLKEPIVIPDWIEYVHDLQNWYYYNNKKKELEFTM